MSGMLKNQPLIKMNKTPLLGSLSAFAAALFVAAALIAFSVLPKNEPHTTAEVEQWAAISDWTASSDAILAENSAVIGFSLSTSSDMLFESLPSSSTTNQNL